MKVTMPSLVEGQTHWKLYSPYEVPIGRDPWPWHHRIIWRVLMWFHNHAEDSWHWLWRISQRFAEPRMRTKTRYHEMKVLRVNGSNIEVNSCKNMVNGAPIFARIPE